MVERFEDLAIGMRFKSPEKVLAREDIKRFSAEFDPQPFRLDEAAAEKTPLRGLAASGWHTAAGRACVVMDALPARRRSSLLVPGPGWIDRAASS